MSFGGQIKLTVAKYYTPSGRCIQKLDYSDGKKSLAIADSLVKSLKLKMEEQLLILEELSQI